MTTVVYTCADAAADYGYCTQLEAFDHPSITGKIRHWRKVKIETDNYRTKYQLQRYTSFLGGAAVVDDPREVEDPRDALDTIFGGW